MKKKRPLAFGRVETCCPNASCCARGKIGEGTICIHGRKRSRYRCQICKKTLSVRHGTMVGGLRTDEETITTVVTGLDERTIAGWQKWAG